MRTLRPAGLVATTASGSTRGTGHLAVSVSPVRAEDETTERRRGRQISAPTTRSAAAYARHGAPTSPQHQPATVEVGLRPRHGLGVVDPGVADVGAALGHGPPRRGQAGDQA